MEIFNKEVEKVQLGHLDNFHTIEIDDDLQMFYEQEASFTPMLSIIQIKENDKLSGNLPFFIDVSIIIPE